MRSLDRLVLVVILQSLEELRGQLRCWIKKPAVTGPSCERPELVIVTASEPLEIARPRRQVGGYRSSPLWSRSREGPPSGAS